MFSIDENQRTYKYAISERVLFAGGQLSILLTMTLKIQITICFLSMMKNICSDVGEIFSLFSSMKREYI